MEKLEDTFAATVMLLSDRPRSPVDALLFHARSFDDEDTLFELAVECYQKDLVKKIIINGSNGEGFFTKEKVWPGADEYYEKLVALGVSQNDILKTETARHTREESGAFLNTVKQNGLHSALILTHPHQILRAFLSMLSILRNDNYPLRAYALAPQTTNWLKEVFGSQAEKRMLRQDNIPEEFKRIDKYQKSNELASLAELFQYLKQRESML